MIIKDIMETPGVVEQNIGVYGGDSYDVLKV